MSLVGILVNYKRSFETPPVPPATAVAVKDVTGNAILYIASQTVEYFNIPVAPEVELIKATGGSTTVKEFTYKRFSDIGDLTGKDTNVRSFQRSKLAAGKGSSRHTVTIPSQRKTEKGNYRVASFRVPSFFTIPMINMLVGSMIKANQPSNYSYQGRLYPFIPNTLTAAPAGVLQAAWASLVYIIPSNADDVPQVGGTTTTTSGRKGSATP